MSTELPWPCWGLESESVTVQSNQIQLYARAATGRAGHVRVQVQARLRSTWILIKNKSPLGIIWFWLSKSESGCVVMLDCMNWAMAACTLTRKTWLGSKTENISAAMHWV
jgi:hypothetical protein